MPTLEQLRSKYRANNYQTETPLDGSIVVPEVVQATVTESVAPKGESFGSAVRNTGKDLVGAVQKVGDATYDTVQDVNQRGKNVRNIATGLGETLNQKSAYGDFSKGVGEKAIDVGVAAGQIAGQIGGAVGDMFTNFFELATNEISPEAKEKIKNSKPVRDIKNAFDNINPKVKADFNKLVEFAKRNPEVASATGDFADVALNILGGGAAESAGKKFISEGAEVVSDLTRGAVDATKRGVEASIPVVKYAAGKVKDAYGNFVAKVDEGIARRQTVNTVDNAIDAITPNTKDLTPTEYEALLSQKRITPKTTKTPSTYILSESEKATATKYKDILQSKDPVKNSINVMEEIASQDEAVGKFLRENNGIYTDGELKNFILDKLKDVSDVTIDQARIETLKGTMIDNFLVTLKKNDMETLWIARKQFDQAIDKAFSGSPTLQNTIKKEFRNSIQDFIAERTPEGIYKAYMKDMRNLFNLHETIATKASKEKGINAIQAWIKDNPAKAQVLGWGAGLLGAQQVYQLLK
jgi:hypothetical protein